MVWIKGPRCGVSNCASNFYQILAGQRVCQYGHVQVGLETTGDEDDYNAIGRKVRKPKSQSQLALASQRNQESQALRGKEARLVTFELLQVILQHQVRFVKSVRKLPPQFESIVRDLWAIFLSIKTNNSPISLVHLLGLIYLSTRIVNVPILLIDFNLWIRSAELPYFQCWLLLDPRLLELMPPEQKKQLRPSSEPGVFYLQKVTQSIKRDLENASKMYPMLNFIDLDERYVCYRICRDLMLPPHIYTGALRLLPLIDKSRCARKGSISLFEEIPAACMVLIAAKLYYGLDGINRMMPEENQFDQGVWQDVLRKTWLMRTEHSRVDERLVEYWDEKEIDNYLSWFQKTILPNKTPLDKRIESMFPLPDADLSSSPHIDQETLKELTAIVHATSNPRSDARTDHFSKPGTNYQSYSVRTDISEELPEPVRVIYFILAKFLGSDEHHIRQCVKMCERWMRRQHEHIFSDERLALHSKSVPTNSN